ncbi:FAD-dependent monooxygenase [Streptomyces sp. RM72]|uniref:FAD-dependent monooxygenase n=1 Tax=Streptomyces sp. RM72 TaxID=1115510 RepID=UPI001B35D0E7|nr:FAD-dependent monooxygenase [Streptomyces sp. RM72]MBQ0891362.1 FAD-dependent monooxygenase [Streptomyces sp. RM72]
MNAKTPIVPDPPVAPDRTVVIAGGGPTGMMLAHELGLAGVPAIVLEREEVIGDHSHNLGVHPRAVEAFAQRGLLSEFGDDFESWPRLHFSMLWLDVPRSGDDFTVIIEQRLQQEVLTRRAAELGVEVRRGHEVVGVEQRSDGVTVTVRSGGEGGDVYTIECRYLVGADGPLSTTREVAGFDCEESPLSYYGIFGDVKLPEGAEAGFVTDVNSRGIFCIWPFQENVIRVMSIEFDARPDDPSTPVTLEELTSSIRRVTGEEMKFHELRWAHRYGGTTLHARDYRKGNVFLAGDAAHRHFVHANHGHNTGIHDAVNLGWKLGADLNGWAPRELLDSYSAERHPVGERACGHGQAQLEIMQSMERSPGLRRLVGELIELDDANRHFVTRVTNVRYPLWDADAADAAHPLLGGRVPGALLEAGGQDTHPLHAARGVLFDLTPGGDAPAAAIAADWSERVSVVPAGPVEGVDATALLVRPDGFVAWVGVDDVLDGLTEALTKWFGLPG